MSFGWSDEYRPALARNWMVTVDPEIQARRRTFQVPVDGLMSFIASAFAGGATQVLLFDGRYRVRVTWSDSRK